FGSVGRGREARDEKDGESEEGPGLHEHTVATLCAVALRRFCAFFLCAVRLRSFRASALRWAPCAWCSLRLTLAIRWSSRFRFRFAAFSCFVTVVHLRRLPAPLPAARTLTSTPVSVANWRSWLSWRKAQTTS